MWNLRKYASEVALANTKRLCGLFNTKSKAARENRRLNHPTPPPVAPCVP